MKVNSVLVVGGSGFVGRHLVASLAAAGIRVTVPSPPRARQASDPPSDGRRRRSRRDGARRARASQRRHAGGLQPGRYPSQPPWTPRSAVERIRPGFRACACRASAGRGGRVPRDRAACLLHVSALGAAPNAPSEYLRSKSIGEHAVLAAEDLDVTVFRPSVIFGPGDQFLNQFARLARFFPAIAVPCPDARFQPVYVGDVARAALRVGRSAGAWTGLRALRPARIHAETAGRNGLRAHRSPASRAGLSPRLSYFQASVLEHLPGKMMTRDNYRSMQVPNTCSAAFPFQLQPQALEAVAPTYLTPSHPREALPSFAGARAARHAHGDRRAARGSVARQYRPRKLRAGSGGEWRSGRTSTGRRPASRSTRP